VLIDATSGAGGLPVKVADADLYYFAPQKGFASDGGLWLALASPAALERIARIDAERPSVGAARWIPKFLSLTTALENSVKDQTYNTPAVATLFMLATRSSGCSPAVAWTEWSLAPPHPRATSTAGRRARTCDAVRRRSGQALTGRGHDRLRRGGRRREVAATLRANGIVDVEPYRKLGRNQLRVAMFPATDPADVQALTACIDFVLEQSA